MTKCNRSTFIRWHPLPASKQSTYCVGSIKPSVKHSLLLPDGLLGGGGRDLCPGIDSMTALICLSVMRLYQDPPNNNKTAALNINKTCCKERGKYPYEPMAGLPIMHQRLFQFYPSIFPFSTSFFVLAVCSNTKRY